MPILKETLELLKKELKNLSCASTICINLHSGHTSDKEIQINDEDIEILVNFLKHTSYIYQINLEGHAITNKGLKLLATCSTLTRINIMSNPVSDEGIIALSHAPILEELIYTYPAAEHEDDYKAHETIGQNILKHHSEIREHRKNFIAAIIQIGQSFVNKQSPFSVLPLDILLHIVSYFNFNLLGKTEKQGVECAKFIFTNIPIFLQHLKSKQKLVISESSKEVNISFNLEEMSITIEKPEDFNYFFSLKNQTINLQDNSPSPKKLKIKS